MDILSYAIGASNGGSSTVIEAKNITANGTYTAESGKAFSPVVVNVPNPSVGNINITNTNSTDVTNYATAQVVDANLSAGNIKKDVAILGITGTYESEPDLEDITITTNGTYTHSGKDGYDEVVVNVPQSGAPSSSELTFGDDLSYWNYQGKFDWIFNKYGSQITTTNICGATLMFQSSNLTTIPVTLNFSANSEVDCAGMFSYCGALTTLPTMNNLQPSKIVGLLESCANLTDASSLNNINWTRLHSSSGYVSSVFKECYRLRTLPQTFIENLYCSGGTISSYVPHYNQFYCCYLLDRVYNYPIIPNTLTTDRSQNMFGMTNCLKQFTFKTNSGSVYTAPWKSQTISMTSYVGYFSHLSYAEMYLDSTRYSTKRITDAASYETLKNDPDRWTTDVNYSLYDHDSAVETINSLPDSSATGTNTIKFLGASGASTDAGAINTLTAAEIAVATAKGWTVTLV